MICPFKVGDRVFQLCARGGFGYGPEYPVESELVLERDPTYPEATIIAITTRGFEYRYDKPIQFVRPDWGTTQAGEVYEGGFHWWRKVEGRDTPLARIRALVSCYALSNHFNPGGAEFASCAHPEAGRCQIGAMDDEEDYQDLVAWIEKHRAVLDS